MHPSHHSYHNFLLPSYHFPTPISLSLYITIPDYSILFHPTFICLLLEVHLSPCHFHFVSPKVSSCTPIILYKYLPPSPLYILLPPLKTCLTLLEIYLPCGYLHTVGKLCSIEMFVHVSPQVITLPGYPPTPLELDCIFNSTLYNITSKATSFHRLAIFLLVMSHISSLKNTWYWSLLSRSLNPPLITPPYFPTIFTPHFPLVEWGLQE